MDRITVLEKEINKLKNELEHCKRRVEYLKDKLSKSLLSLAENIKRGIT